MFTRMLGAPPRAYLREGGQREPAVAQ